MSAPFSPHDCPLDAAINEAGHLVEMLALATRQLLQCGTREANLDDLRLDCLRHMHRRGMESLALLNALVAVHDPTSFATRVGPVGRVHDGGNIVSLAAVR
jgi:hypothetical protein